MTPKQQKVIEALAERMGWKREPYSAYSGSLGSGPTGYFWRGPDGRRLYDDKPPNPYESEADSAALVDWMVTQKFSITVSWFEHPANWQCAIQTDASLKWISIRNPNRKTAITECAAEALGILENGND